MALAGTSTLGIELYYAVEDTAGEKPDSGYTKLTRINNIGGIAISTEQIDASALEDYVTRYVAGRGDNGGEWTVTVNMTDDTIAEWNTLISASDTAYQAGKSTWFEVVSPYLAKAFFVTAQVPKNIPMPELGQNALATVEMTLTINEYKGMDTKITA